MPEAAREARGGGRRGPDAAARRGRGPRDEGAGLAEGEAVKAKGLAEADAIRARADALVRKQEAVIAQQIAEQLPKIVGESSKAFGNIDQLTVLNGRRRRADVLAGARHGRGGDPAAPRRPRP